MNREPYQRYSQHARRALDQARLLAKARAHPIIDSTHLLISIAREEGSIGCNVLRGLHLEAERAEALWIPHLASSDGSLSHSHSPALQEAVRLASDESRWLGQTYIGTEHLLLGICRVAEPTLADLLVRLAVDSGAIRREIRRLLRTGMTEIGVEQVRRMAHLSELSRRVLNAAEQIADQMNHKQIGLAHLLLVLAHERRSACSQILQSAGLDAKLLEADLRKPRPVTGGMLDDILDRAVEHGEQIGSHYTGTDHILLAMAREPRGARLLRKYGASPNEIERRLRENLKP